MLSAFISTTFCPFFVQEVLQYERVVLFFITYQTFSDFILHNALAFNLFLTRCIRIYCQARMSDKRVTDAEKKCPNTCHRSGKPCPRLASHPYPQADKKIEFNCR